MKVIDVMTKNIISLKTTDTLIDASKLLKKYKKLASSMLDGIVETDETFFLFSEKGDKSVAKRRKPRKKHTRIQYWEHQIHTLG